MQLSRGKLGGASCCRASPQNSQEGATFGEVPHPSEKGAGPGVRPMRRAIDARGESVGSAEAAHWRSSCGKFYFA